MNKTEKQNPISQTESKPSKNYIFELIMWGAIVFLIWLIYLLVSFLIPYCEPNALPDVFKSNEGFQVGTFGDYFGALNALFAGFAFAGIIVTIRQQSADLQATKHEMQNQTNQFKLQNEQEKVTQIKVDLHNRILLIKQLEKDIELEIWKENEITAFKGAEALNELSYATIRMCQFLFPDNEHEAKSLVISNIAYDCLLYAKSFTYIDAWINNIYLLLDDINEQFNDLKHSTVGTLEELNKSQKRCFKIILRTILPPHLSLLVFYHDTHAKAPIINNFIKEGLLDYNWVAGCATHPIKRKLFYKLICGMLTPSDPKDVVFSIVNEWRKHNNWYPMPPYIRVNESEVQHDQYDIPIELLQKHSEEISKMYNSYAKASILSTNCSVSLSAAPVYLYFNSENSDYYFSSFNQQNINTDTNNYTLLWVYSTMKHPVNSYHFADELIAFQLN